MKSIQSTLLILILACLAGFAQEPVAAPPEMIALKNRYEQESSEATKYIRERYISDLRNLLRTATQRGDMAGAQAILTEMKSAAPEPELTSKLPGTWHFSWPGGSQDVVFHEDGTLLTSRGEKGRWVVRNDKVLMNYASGHADTLMLPLDVNGTNGKSWVGNTQIKGTKVSEAR